MELLDLAKKLRTHSKELQKKYNLPDSLPTLNEQLSYVTETGGLVAQSDFNNDEPLSMGEIDLIFGVS